MHDCKPLISSSHQRCIICSKPTETVLAFIDYPITGPLSPQKTILTEKADLKLNVCPKCHHASILNPIPPSELYSNDTYVYNTSQSISANANTLSFANYVKSQISNFDILRTEQIHVLEFGANDLTLAKLISKNVKNYTAVDPFLNLQNKEELGIENIHTIKDYVEKISTFGKQPKPNLIICQHTFEHLLDPISVLRHLINLSNDQAVFIFEFPLFDNICIDQRFDQIFHHHPQYFSFSSICKMLKDHDLSLIDLSEISHWGSVRITFSKNCPQYQTISNTKLSLYSEKSNFIIPNIKNEFNSFNEWCVFQKNSLEVLSRREPIWGYGASQILPNYAFHLKSDLSFLQGIIDDNKNKNLSYYPSLKPQIINCKELFGKNILITAIDNSRRILNKLFNENSKRIINLHWSI